MTKRVLNLTNDLELYYSLIFDIWGDGQYEVFNSKF